MCLILIIIPISILCQQIDEKNLVMKNGIYFEAGKDIPRDISIIGYDDSPVAVSGKVKLTTVTGHHNKLGIAAAELILKRIANPQEPSQSIVFAPSLIIRESTMNLNSG